MIRISFVVVFFFFLLFPVKADEKIKIIENFKKIEIIDVGWLRNSFNQENYFFEGFIIFCGSTNSSKSSPDM